MADITEVDLERYMWALSALTREGYAGKDDRWLMQEACKRASIDWKAFERKFLGRSVAEAASSRFADLTKPPIGLCHS
jgi:hypothetical protein